MRPHISTAAVAVVLLLAVIGCGSPEEKKAKYLAQAQDYIHDGNLPKARVALRNVLKIDPKDPEAYFFFAEVEEKEKNWRNAFANYQRTVELKPDHERALIKLAKFYLEGRAMDKVLEMTDKVLDKSPGQVEAESLRIAVQAVNGNLSEATLAAEALGAKHPTDPDAATILATMYLAQGRRGEVEPVMQRAVDANPGNLVLLDSFASALLRLDKSERAEEILKKIVAAEPKVLDHRLRLAGFYDERREYDKAETILREVIRLDPDNEQRHLELAKFRGIATRRLAGGSGTIGRDTRLATVDGYSVRAGRVIRTEPAAGQGEGRLRAGSGRASRQTRCAGRHRQTGCARLVGRQTGSGRETVV